MDIVVGRSGAGKTTYCLNQIADFVRNRPLGRPLIMLVPEQVTLQMEKALVWDRDLGGIMRIQVLSFERLVRRLLTEVQGNQKVRMSEAGRQMTLVKILLQHRAELQSFGPMATSPGLVDGLSHLITELRTYRVFPQDLERTLREEEGTPLEKALRAKLEDVAFVYRNYHEATVGRVLDWDYEMEAAADLVPAAPFLQEARFWVDGFKGFTPQEMGMLAALLRVAGHMTVTLPLDPALTVSPIVTSGQSAGLTPEISREREDADPVSAGIRQLFSPVLETYRALQEICHNAGCSYQPIRLTANYRTRSHLLRHLERSFGQYPVVRYSDSEALPAVLPAAPAGANGIEIHACADRRSEVIAVARRMNILVRDKGLAWRDMAILTRGLEEYEELLEQELTRYEVPFFLDRTRLIQSHPLLSLVDALLELGRCRWQTADLFSALRTGFFPLTRDAIDRFENYCLAAGVDARDWEKGRLWGMEFPGGHRQNRNPWRTAEQKNIAATFQVVHEHLAPWVHALARADQDKLTVREISVLLCTFLENLEVPAQLRRWEDVQSVEDPLNAQIHRQIWEHFVQVADEMVTVLGDEEIGLLVYKQIWKTGFHSMPMGVIPPRLNEVVIGSIERTRLPEVKTVFIIGASEGILPPEAGTEGLFDPRERAMLRAAGVRLNPKGKHEDDEEMFYIYTALSCPRDHLVLSYPLNGGGSPLPPSFLIRQLRTMFPTAPFVNGLLKTGPVWDEQVLAHPLAVVEEYVRDRQGKYGTGSVYERWLLERSPYRDLMRKLVELEGREKNKERIPRRLVRQMYGQPLRSSVSQLETYAECPFAHFIRYGLKAKERRLFSLEAPDIGAFSHVVLSEYARRLYEKGQDWHDMTPETARTLLADISSGLLQRPEYLKFTRKARYRYMLERQQQVLAFVLRVLGGLAGQFTTVGVEIPFGEQAHLPALRIPLRAEDTLVIQGKIDRLDAAQVGDSLYVRVVDYKARRKQFDLVGMTAGLELQLPLYLEAALQGEGFFRETMGRSVYRKAADGRPRVEPGGFAYFPIVEQVTTAKSFADVAKEAAKREKELRMAGFLVDDAEVITALGEKLRSSKGQLQDKNVLTLSQFRRLGRFARAVAQQQGEEILSGKVDIHPLRYKRENACQFCAYHSICRFDRSMGQRYRFPAYAEGDVRCLLDEPEETWRLTEPGKEAGET